MPTTKTQFTVADFNRIVSECMPFAELLGVKIEEISAERAVMRAVSRDEFLRPGGTIGGPVMMSLVDYAFYAVVLGNLGPSADLAVTTNFSINFLRKPPPGDILAEATILKLGKRLVVCEATVYSEALPKDAQTIAHATGTYSIPPLEKRV